MYLLSISCIDLQPLPSVSHRLCQLLLVLNFQVVPDEVVKSFIQSSKSNSYDEVQNAVNNAIAEGHPGTNKL